MDNRQDVAVDHQSAAAELYHILNQHVNTLTALNKLGILNLQRGKLEDAMFTFERMLSFAKEHDKPEFITLAQDHLQLSWEAATIKEEQRESQLLQQSLQKDHQSDGDIMAVQSSDSRASNTSADVKLRHPRRSQVGSRPMSENVRLSLSNSTPNELPRRNRPVSVREVPPLPRELRVMPKNKRRPNPQRQSSVCTLM